MQTSASQQRAKVVYLDGRDVNVVVGALTRADGWHIVERDEADPRPDRKVEIRDADVRRVHHLAPVPPAAQQIEEALEALGDLVEALGDLVEAARVQNNFEGGAALEGALNVLRKHRGR